MSGTSPTGPVPSKADTFLISCIDPRLADDTTFRFEALGRTNRYSEMRIAGAALAIVDDRNPRWQATLWENLAATRAMHGIRNVTLLNHRDCGAMNAWAGRRLADDPADELRVHTEVLNAAADAIRARHPDLLIEIKLMDLEGHVERPICRSCVPAGFRLGPVGTDGIPMLELQRNMGVASSTTSRNVSTLSDVHWRDPKKPGLGLIERHEDPNDRRNKIVRLSAKGRRILGTVNAIMEK